MCAKGAPHLLKSGCTGILEFEMCFLTREYAFVFLSLERTLFDHGRTEQS